MSRVRDIIWSRVDPPCINLIKAINRIPGIKTTQSCCGHGTGSFLIWFKVSDPKKYNNLNLMAFVVSRNYGCPEGWRIELSWVEIRKSHPEYLLTSGNNKGERAYKQAEYLAGGVYHFLHHKKWRRKFMDK